jgi:dTDP-4-dehydrorhamnose reductase
MRVLITGVSGFIGSHLFCNHPDNVEIWGTYLDSQAIGDAARMLRVDLRDPFSVERILDGVQPDVLIHCAAYSQVALCEKAPTAAWEVNSRVTADIARLCAARNVRLVFLSSDMLFDGTKGNYRETDDPNPINFYGWTKFGAERRILEQHSDAVIVRVNLTYGAPFNGGHSFSQEVIETVRSGNPYYLFSDQYRSFISVKNLAECLWELASAKFVGILHLGGPEAADRVTFARKLADRVGLNTDLLIPVTAEQVHPQVPYPKNNTFDLSLAQSLLKTPLLSLDEGLALEYPS